MFKKWIVALAGSLAIIFGVYAATLYSLAARGNALFEKRCLGVNPLLITYKNTFLKYADQINNPEWASGQQVMTLMVEYNEQMNRYIAAESKWLGEDTVYLESPIFRLFAPKYLKDAARLQWKMYEAYRDDAQYIHDLWLHPEKITAMPDPDYVSEPRSRRDKYIEAYFNEYGKAAEKWDWRKYFMRVPPPKGCTKENTTFPTTEGSIKWDTGAGQNPSPADVPIDPYATS